MAAKVRLEPARRNFSIVVDSEVKEHSTIGVLEG